MTRRRPLRWRDDAVHGLWPDCDECISMWFNPMFVEAVYSVSIEHPGNPRELARRTLDSYHEGGHEEGGP